METMKLNGRLDKEKLVLEFGADKTIEIATLADIELTELVEYLTHMLSTKKVIDAHLTESDEPKLKIVIETVSGIIESYNGSIRDYLESKAAIEQEA